MDEPIKGLNPEMLAALSHSVVAAYVSNNAVLVTDLPKLIEDVHAAFAAAAGATRPTAKTEAPKPAVVKERSVSRNHITCLEDGKKFKTLKRHLLAAHGMTPAAYREKWNLPASYPMAAPGYSEQRAVAAKELGLGTKRHARRGTK